MPIFEALTVVRRPGGQVIFDVGQNGFNDAQGRGLYTPVDVRAELNAAAVDKFIFTALEGVWRPLRVAEAHSAVGGAGANVQVVYCPGSGAIGSGTAQLTAVLDLTVAAPVIRYGTLIASPNLLFPGDSLALDFSGTLTGLSGLLTVQLGRVS